MTAAVSSRQAHQLGMASRRWTNRSQGSQPERVVQHVTERGVPSSAKKNST